MGIIFMKTRMIIYLYCISIQVSIQVVKRNGKILHLNYGYSMLRKLNKIATKWTVKRRIKPHGPDNFSKANHQEFFNGYQYMDHQNRLRYFKKKCRK